MRSRLTPILVCLVTLAMVVFGQVCALSTLVRGVDPATLNLVASVPATDDPEATCNPADCEGGGDEAEGEGCPAGASSCCSTWGPPISRLSLTPPASSVVLSDEWLVFNDGHRVEQGATEVALFELARPPGLPTDALLVSSLSRRGPPAIS